MRFIPRIIDDVDEVKNQEKKICYDMTHIPDQFNVSKEKYRAIRRACRKDKMRYTEDKCATIVGLFKQMRMSEMYKEIRTLIKKFTPKLNVIKDAKCEPLTENEDILASWKEHCEGLFTKYGNTEASTTDCDDNE